MATAMKTYKINCEITPFAKKFYLTGNNFMIHKGLKQRKQIETM